MFISWILACFQWRRVLCTPLPLQEEVPQVIVKEFKCKSRNGSRYFKVRRFRICDRFYLSIDLYLVWKPLRSLNMECSWTLMMVWWQFSRRYSIFIKHINNGKDNANSKATHIWFRGECLAPIPALQGCRRLLCCSPPHPEEHLQEGCCSKVVVLRTTLFKQPLWCLGCCYCSPHRPEEHIYT